jgi:hypothetical protein
MCRGNSLYIFEGISPAMYTRFIFLRHSLPPMYSDIYGYMCVCVCVCVCVSLMDHIYLQMYVHVYACASFYVCAICQSNT